MADLSIPLKQCNRKERCVHPDGSWLPATPEYFGRNQNNPDGLQYWCRHCDRVYKREWRAAHRESTRQSQKQWVEEHADQYTEIKRESDHRYYFANAERIKARVLRYRIANAEWKRDYDRRWQRENADKKNTYSRNWRKRNPDKVREQCRKWRRQNPEKARAITQRRIAKRRELPSTLTNEQWERCLEYWDYKCCVCRRPVGLWHILAEDHWIPQSKGGGYTNDNIVPLCHSRDGSNGLGSCNHSKGNKMPLEWLIEEFGEHEAQRILERFEAYWKSLL